MAFLKAADQKNILYIYFKRPFCSFITNKQKKIVLPLLYDLSVQMRFTAVSATAVKHVIDTQVPKRDPLDLTFANPEAAFKSKTTWEVVRALIVYHLCSSSYLVENNTKLMKLGQTILGKNLFGKVMKMSFYGHFVAGEDQHSIIPTLQRLRSFGVKPILDYSVEEDISQEEAEKREIESSMSELEKRDKSAAADEVGAAVGGVLPQFHVDKNFADRRYKVASARTYFYLNEATCERNVEIFQDCLQSVAGATYGTGLAAIKMTALGRPQLLV